MSKFKLTSFNLFCLPLLQCSLTACLNTSADLNPVDGTSVMSHVQNIVRNGPHPAGSDAQKKVAQYLIEQLESYGLQVKTQTFHPVTPLGRLEMNNIWGVIPGRRESVIILASHYDSKFFEDFDFVGANDGGSSSALLLELARILAGGNPGEHSIWVVFFDGEEAFMEWTRVDSLYGSREFVKMLKLGGELSKISALILLDMVGAKNLVLFQDVNSTAWLNQIVWDKAEEMGHGSIFRKQGKTAAEDDHIPFAREGIPVIDIIDLNYVHWHRQEDTLDKLSARNLTAVGHVVLSSLVEIDQYLQR
jgi:glutaminyl-peptide cyclotransferase